MRKRHTTPAVSVAISQLRMSIGAVVYNEMEAEVMTDFLNSKRKAEESLRSAVEKVKRRRVGQYAEIDNNLMRLMGESNNIRAEMPVVPVELVNPFTQGIPQFKPEHVDDEEEVLDNPDAHQAILEHQTLNALANANL